jgi:glycogen synthase
LSRYPDAIQRAQEQFLTWRLMKILFFSYTFAPNVGGIESVSAILAEKFAEAGHEVELVTETADKENAQRSIPDRNYRITRRPLFLKLIRLLSWCELVFQNNISLRSLIPALLMQKRVIVVHQTWLRHVRGGIGWNNRVKRVLLRFVTNVAISEATRKDLWPAGDAPAPQFQMRVIGNPYDDGVFRLRPEIARDKALVFVGRLVSDKGVDVLLRALNILHNENVAADLTIVGSGPEEEKLRGLAQQLGLGRRGVVAGIDDSGLPGSPTPATTPQVTFAGEKSGEELAATLNRHQIMVVPSRWAEPFGIVALEGIACGCAVVGSRDGGLREAIGPCGLTFKNGDERELADSLKALLLDPQQRAVFQKDASAHLEKFRADAVAAAYLALIQEIQ